MQTDFDRVACQSIPLEDIAVISVGAEPLTFDEGVDNTFVCRAFERVRHDVAIASCWKHRG